METKKLEITLDNAIKAHANGCSDVKRVLENLFGQDTFKPKDIASDINKISDVYNRLGCNPDKDILNIDGFDDGQTNTIKAIIKKMRVCEAYNGRKKLNLNDRRYYNWYVKNSSGSGLAFHGSSYHGGNAHLSSAARLSFSNQNHLNDARSKFPELDLDIFDLK